MTDPRRAIPRTDVLLADPRLRPLREEWGDPAVKSAVTAAQAAARAGTIGPDEVLSRVLHVLAAPATGLRAVINATGVVLHTNLGRAPLSAPARAAVQQAAGYVDLEFDLDAGRRGRRARGALAALTDAVPAAADALVVNNGAAALVLAATALGAGRELVLSRGEMVEIGDGFRLPDLLASTGARLVEVGTTNRTTAADYRAAVGPDTGAIVKIHPSNFRVLGFSGSPAVGELTGWGVPVVVDIGSGLLAPEPLLPDEPDAAGTLAAGADLVTASGDKLLGGPQAGLVLGRADLVQQLRRHPLARALRADKLTLAALEATLRRPRTPTWLALHADPDVLRQRCRALAERLPGAATVVPSAGAVGGGGAPGVELPGWAVAVPEELARPLRQGDPPVVGRLESGCLLLDLRCVPPEDDARLLERVTAAWT